MDLVEPANHESRISLQRVLVHSTICWTDTGDWSFIVKGLVRYLTRSAYFEGPGVHPDAVTGVDK
jgi:hypothetical protein